jgi:hypothetical protein
MGLLGDSAAGLRRDLRVFSERDSRSDLGGDCQSGLPVYSRRRSQADLRRGLRGDLAEYFRGDFIGVSRVEDGLRERSSRFSSSGGRKGGSFAAALQGSYRCTMTL